MKQNDPYLIRWIKNGNKVFDKLPEGWKYIDDNDMILSPAGYKLATNGKSKFSKDFKHAMIKQS